jgi:hypothetical protein
VVVISEHGRPPVPPHSRQRFRICMRRRLRLGIWRVDRDVSAPVLPSAIALFAGIPPGSSPATDSCLSRTPRACNNALYETYPAHSLSNMSLPGGTYVSIPSSLDSHLSPSHPTPTDAASASPHPGLKLPSSICHAKTLLRRGETSKPCTTSLNSAAGTSYSHYDPAVPLDPVYFKSGEYLRDGVTEVNMAGNGRRNGSRQANAMLTWVSYLRGLATYCLCMRRRCF